MEYPIHILLLEDDESLVDMLQYVVDQLQLKITTAATIMEAKKAFQDNKDINLGMIDFNVPGSDNTYPDDLTEEGLPKLFKSRPEFDYFFITGEANLTLAKAKHWGAVDILRKPFTCEELQSVVEAISERKSICSLNSL